ncbi:hypothetical protein M406DRAFT_357248 [Cryphonectria parasitica EP155]|uniref:Uncharacterized protein n=1 Tax=Cryphonectria parasitica (strain ATCC 38755 / EP155) TaxID=660469 RepID=A0A9P5CN13_CRYP1|nr:uncharacterized protein M406DRAFT_357248 [Cryphonectria parasitica EP155]KAF3763832.1 hypothetical protein M406DRAFT_357248 [Cryphonectria parasitica EP155]
MGIREEVEEIQLQKLYDSRTDFSLLCELVRKVGRGKTCRLLSRPYFDVQNRLPRVKAGSPERPGRPAEHILCRDLTFNAQILEDDATFYGLDELQMALEYPDS